MNRAKLSRDEKRQLGQFLTPPPVAAAVVGQLEIPEDGRVLEPSLGTGAFAFAVIDTLAQRVGRERATTWARKNFHGCEIDTAAFTAFAAEWHARGLGELPSNVDNVDFFRWMPPECERHAALDRARYTRSTLAAYDLIVGNPPFGGSIAPEIQDPLDRIFGIRDGFKIKKETYAFFLVKCVDLLKPNGRLCFICSDTILTIPTMRGLRRWLQNECDVEIAEIPGSFDDTSQQMVLVTLTKRRQRGSHIVLFGNSVSVADIQRTSNLSWRLDREFTRYFTGETLGGRMIATSGMTVGRNALFVREISDSAVEEPYEFSLGTEPITLARELQRARLGQLSPGKQRAIAEQQTRGETRPIVAHRRRDTPVRIELPHGDYRYYNTATADILYSPPRSAIFWRDDGEYVYVFKKSGNWYLHGVGGRPYFGREGLTWALISSRLRTRWLPPGYILDSGAPCAFLRPGVHHDELWFVMGWTLTELCTRILKNVINHTRNIQSKDFERLPYPVWVSPSKKQAAIQHVQELVELAKTGLRLDFEDPRVRRLEEFYAYDGRPPKTRL